MVYALGLSFFSKSFSRMPVLQLNQLVPGQEYTVVFMNSINHGIPVAIDRRRRFLRIENAGDDMDRPIFDAGHGASSAYHPDSLQIYAIGDPDIPVIAPVAPVAVVAPANGNNANGNIPVLSAMNGQNPNCAVCLDPLINDGEHGQVVACETTVARAAGTAEDKVRCGHKFHRDCIRGWLDAQPAAHKVCPACNQFVKRLRRANAELQAGGSRKTSQRRKSRKNKQTRKNRQRRS